MADKFNSDMLELARRLRGFTQSELVRVMDKSISQAYLSKMERGEAEPTAEHVTLLSKALSIPECFFSQPEHMHALPISFHAYRKKASVTKKQLDLIHAQMNLKLLHAQRMLAEVGVASEVELPELSLADFNGNPEAAAAYLRDYWALEKGPVQNLVDVVERAGVLVFMCDYPEGQVDGVTMRVDGLPPCVFLNSNQSADRMRFSLAHELGHIVLHKVPSLEMEDEANKFAAELLLPANEIKPQLGSITLQSLGYLKSVWKASMGAILFRAKTLQTITESQSTYLWRQMSVLGYRRREPVELEREVPTGVAKMIRRYVEARGWSLPQLVDAFCLHAEDFEGLYRADLVCEGGAEMA